MDIDKNGVLSLDELKKGYTTYINEGATEAEIERLFKKADSDNSGYIDWREFIEIAMNQDKLIKREKLKAAFDEIDRDGSGTIDKEEIKLVMGRVNESLAADEAAE